MHFHRAVATSNPDSALESSRLNACRDKVLDVEDANMTFVGTGIHP